ncbi:hypothetical protein OPQ81_006829 [Rhizoctonia solani]|nr:hypothetical protein OPQ81_006829 [Rhizoctonia solani]
MVMSSSPPLSTLSSPHRLRRQPTIETPPLLSISRRNSRSQSTPPQDISPISPTSLGESIFQSLSFGLTKPMPLADVLESPTSVGHEGPETPRAMGTYTSRRRVTSPDTAHPFQTSPSPDTPTRQTTARSPPPALPLPPPFDPHPRKHRSTLRLSRLRPGIGKDEMAQLDSTVNSPAETRPSSARGNPPTDRQIQRAASVRRPGSAGGVPLKAQQIDQPRPGSSKGRGMRVRASSELTRPSVPLAAILQADEHPPSPRLRPPMPGESALAGDSDIDTSIIPSLTTVSSGTSSRSKSDTPGSGYRSPLSTTPKPSMSNLDSDILAPRTRDDPDRRRKGEPENYHARKQQSKYFKLKGPGKERCHAFSAKDAPYPISYSHKMLDHYNLEVDVSYQTVRGLTFHKFESPPAKVLDLGCGTGYWIIKAAHQWTQTQFVGFDLVPIQPSLERVTSRSGVSTSKTHADLRLHERIHWVHGNFLEKLPFEDSEFDFVRCRKIARGVPESKWDGLYEEIVRVMKPGAAFEHIEEDILFPSEISNKPTNPPPVAVYNAPSPARVLSTPPYTTPPYLSSTSLPHGSSSISTVRTPDQYRRSPSTSFSSVIESPVEGRNIVPSVSSTSSTSLAGSNEPRTRTTLVVPGSTTTTSNPPIPEPLDRDSRGSGESNGHGRHQAADYSFHDPRVHTRLEELFISMHDARWINLKPLSLLPRLIQERMTGMIASPPVNMFLPPRPREGPIPDREVGAIEVARGNGDVLVKQLSKMRIPGSGPEFDEKLLVPKPGDEEISRFLTFDFSRMGSVARGGGAGMMPTGQFGFNLNWLVFHLSIAVAEVVACKEAIWEHLKEMEPEADRREFDAMVRQYQADMQDRIGLSGKLRDKLQWGPPESDFMKTPEQRVFEEHYAQAIARDVQQGGCSQATTSDEMF